MKRGSLQPPPGERYDRAAAAHYAAYRPPLHRPILDRVLDGNPFASGLDVGCGTGYSAVALATHCRSVCALDSSLEMLRQATPHARVHYVAAAAESIPLATHFDVATLAGSLFYIDARAAREELCRLCGGGVVVVYDFEVLLEPTLRRLGYAPRQDARRYDHRANFTGVPGFELLAGDCERVNLDVTSVELAHIVLSDSHVFDFLATKLGARDPFAPLLDVLQAGAHRIAADIYYAKYRVTQKGPLVTD